MNITLEQWAKLEEKIRENIKWAAYTKRVGFLHKLYISGTLDAPQYLDLQEECLLTYAGENK